MFVVYVLVVVDYVYYVVIEYFGYDGYMFLGWVVVVGENDDVIGFYVGGIFGYCLFLV